MFLSSCIILLCIAALANFWQPRGLASLVTTGLCGAGITLLATFSHHPWAQVIGAIGWTIMGLIALAGVGILALILVAPHRVVRKHERLTSGILLIVWAAVFLNGGWLTSLLAGRLDFSLWEWFGFVPVFTLYIGLIFGASLLGVARAALLRSQRADTIVILGAGLLRGHHIGRVLGNRLLAGLRLANRQKTPPVIIVTGGQGPDETMSEAAAMAAFLQRHGYDTAKIRLEDQATNTQTNLINSQRLWQRLPHGGGRVVVVTSNYHLFRAEYLASRLGLIIGGYPAPTRLTYLPLGWSREFLAILMFHPRLHRGVLIALFTVNLLWMIS
ncbi:hypothetical protein FD13_GL000212 [Levilactobacillus senmaizukei DSM 21775 = NBRC 103853]|uniref:DUF218 domain-containing protein n=1 Tax=Levilactobacillus senmaizukei DSM 21775 = NBRC 103853 TaxID=1423803 RepID=A0A0R2DH37_9LACO|nr:YdcF family protein [Levilactobacillus senmaizukei]KRN03423.1 hypothetical protein FD13_GL000212 [Levilactobacillus senmaizukei DSM 21775 = NBRC 103853]